MDEELGKFYYFAKKRILFLKIMAIFTTDVLCVYTECIYGNIGTRGDTTKGRDTLSLSPCRYGSATWRQSDKEKT